MGSIIPFPVRPAAAPPPVEAHPVRLEAQHWEHQHGRDAYSAFLLKHGKRPNPGQADIIGKIVGRRVKASDGFRYPKLVRASARQTETDRKTWEKIKRRHREISLKTDSQPQPPS